MFLLLACERTARTPRKVDKNWTVDSVFRIIERTCSVSGPPQNTRQNKPRLLRTIKYFILILAQHRSGPSHQGKVVSFEPTQMLWPNSLVRPCYTEEETIIGGCYSTKCIIHVVNSSHGLRCRVGNRRTIPTWQPRLPEPHNSMSLARDARHSLNIPKCVQTMPEWLGLPRPQDELRRRRRRSLRRRNIIRVIRLKFKLK